jgi:hypothetical protein
MLSSPAVELCFLGLCPGVKSVVHLKKNVLARKQWGFHISVHKIYYPSQCCGSEMFIPDPTFSIPHRGSKKKDPGPDPHQRILVFSTLKTVFKLSEKLSGILIRIPDPDFFPIPDPRSGSRGQINTGSRIRNTDSSLRPGSQAYDAYGIHINLFVTCSGALSGAKDP